MMALAKAEEWTMAELRWWSAYCATTIILGAINTGRKIIEDIKKAKIQAEQASCVAAHHKILVAAYHRRLAGVG